VEVNALSDFTATVMPEKTGRRVTSVRIGWGAKGIEGRKAAYTKLQRPPRGPQGTDHGLPSKDGCRLR